MIDVDYSSSIEWPSPIEEEDENIDSRIALTSFAIFGGFCCAPFFYKKRIIQIGGIEQPVADSIHLEPVEQVPLLPAAPGDEAKIAQIITIMGTNPSLPSIFPPSLGLSYFASYLTQLGNEIDPIHPFQFLGAIFGNPELKRHMRGIMDDFIKRRGFLGGVERGMTRDYQQLAQYLDSFAHRVGTTAAALRPYIEAKDWTGITEHLIGVRSLTVQQSYLPPAHAAVLDLLYLNRIRA
jgi:hypothetical protein